MVFKTILVKLGHSSTKIDLILDQDEYELGDLISGQLRVKGGNVPQQINKINVDLVVSIDLCGHHFEKKVQRFEFDVSFELQPDEEKFYPFSYHLPYNLLVSGHNISYFFITHLAGIDSSDRDLITIHPPVQLQNVLTALNHLGYYEKHNSREFDGYLQKFELSPTLNNFVKGIEFNAILEDNGIRLLLEVELISSIEEKEIRREIFLTTELLNDLDQLTSYLQLTIQEVTDILANFYVNKEQFHYQYHQALGAIGGAVIDLIEAKAIKEALESMDDIVEEHLEEDNNNDSGQLLTILMESS